MKKFADLAKGQLFTIAGDPTTVLVKASAGAVRDKDNKWTAFFPAIPVEEVESVPEDHKGYVFVAEKLEANREVDALRTELKETRDKLREGFNAWLKNPTDPAMITNEEFEALEGKYVIAFNKLAEAKKKAETPEEEDSDAETSE